MSNFLKMRTSENCTTDIRRSQGLGVVNWKSWICGLFMKSLFERYWWIYKSHKFWNHKIRGPLVYKAKRKTSLARLPFIELFLSSASFSKLENSNIETKNCFLQLFPDTSWCSQNIEGRNIFQGYLNSLCWFIKWVEVLSNPFLCYHG